MSTSLFYDSDDAYPYSPTLQPVYPRATPSPPPPPRLATVSDYELSLPWYELRDPSQSESWMQTSQRTEVDGSTVLPSPLDSVLIGVMDPNSPQIARIAGGGALVSDDEPEVDFEDHITVVKRQIPENGFDGLLSTGVGNHVYPPSEIGSNQELQLKSTQGSAPFDGLQERRIKALSKENRMKQMRTRWDLPIILDSQNGPETVMACPDSASDVNVISAELAKVLGLNINEGNLTRKPFSLANGSIVEDVGQVLAKCAFATGSDRGSSDLKCLFYVFKTLAVPLIMGMAFLESTKTMTVHRDRLVPRLSPMPQALKVMSINRPTKGMICRLESEVIMASPDTGSELDLISWEFAFNRGFKIMPGKEQLMFADGSIGTTSGVVQTTLSVAQVDRVNQNDSRLWSEELGTEFHVLENLLFDVLVGEDTLEDLEVFTAHEDALIAMPSMSPSINIIRRIGNLENALRNSQIYRWAQKLFKGKNTPDPVGSSEEEQMKAEQRENARREQKTEQDSLNSRELTIPPSKGPNLTSLDLVDIAQAALQSAENASVPADTRIPQPVPRGRMSIDGAVNRKLPPPTGPHIQHIPPHGVGGFKCEHPGCRATPFQTQYLLNSHANVHSQNRPHYCPVSGCPRAEGGKEFKRENEMIRHRLFHGSPGYVCPFCPDRELKYPRPDNLQRHVRVYHVDRDKDDPRLREVLAQLPEGGSRGRRRRAHDGFGLERANTPIGVELAC